MSRYHLTEAYGELYNTRLTEDSYYDNLRFVDYLQPEQIEEVMESLIWEFMDYGDSLEEATDILELAFSDDEIICESLEFISEARYTGRNEMERRREMRQKQAEQSRQSERERSANIRSFAKRDADTAARARRAERAAAVRGALRGAKQSVKGALSKGQQFVTNKRSQLAAAGSRMASKVSSGVSNAALRGQAALSRVARTARGTIGGAIRGAKEGASQAWNAPSPVQQPKPKMTRSQYELRKNIRSAQAKQALGQPFATPSVPAADSAAADIRAKTARQGRTYPNPSKVSDPWQEPYTPRTSTTKVRDVTRRPAALPPSGKSSGSTKGGRVLTGSQRQTKNAALARRQGLNASVDYDLLTQYMIEDLIYEGYATDEQEALDILEQMEPETLTEFANVYLQD